MSKWTKLHQFVTSHPDRLSGTILMGLSLIALAEARHLPFGSLLAPDAGFFPQTLSALLLIVSAIIVVGSFITKSEPAHFSARSWHVAIAIAAFITYGLVLPRVGFVIATVIIMLLMVRGLGGMKWTQALMIALPSVLLSYFAFTQLGVPLPRGPLPF
jgi:hypothetical protein